MIKILAEILDSFLKEIDPMHYLPLMCKKLIPVIWTNTIQKIAEKLESDQYYALKLLLLPTGFTVPPIPSLAFLP